MPATDASAVAAKWKTRLSGSIDAIKSGVNAMTQNPMEKAASRQDQYLAGVQRAVESGKYAEGLRSVPFTEWKRLMLEKGVQRISTGAAEAQSKMRDFYTQLLPYTARVSEEIAAMPKGTLEDSAARMMANMQKMSQFRFRKRSGS